jgi:hypothetical protein
MMELYHHVRFRWWIPVDLREAEILFRSRGFSVEKSVSARGGLEMSFRLGDTRDRLIVKADTLEAFVTSYVAILFQQEAAFFTEQDWMLMRTVFHIYEWGRSGEPILPLASTQRGTDSM